MHYAPVVLLSLCRTYPSIARIRCKLAKRLRLFFFNCVMHIQTPWCYLVALLRPARKHQKGGLSVASSGITRYIPLALRTRAKFVSARDILGPCCSTLMNQQTATTLSPSEMHYWIATRAHSRAAALCSTYGHDLLFIPRDARDGCRHH